jgi:hypothetical protein
MGSSFSYDGLSDFTPQQQRLIRRLIDSHNNVAGQVNATPLGNQTPPPIAHSKLDVSGGAGMFSVQITPSDKNFRGCENMLEVSEDANFSNPHLIHLGASTSWHGYLGEKTLHFRSFAQHDTSPPSEPVYCKNVSAVGGTAPAITSNQPGLTGYGTTPYVGSTPPKRRVL